MEELKMAYILAIGIGLLLRKIAMKLEIPQLLFYMLVGFVLSYFTTLPYGDYIRHVALVLVLLRSGLGINLSTLKQVGKETTLLSFVPALFEGFAVLVMALLLTQMSVAEAGMMGFMLGAVSPAVVIPMMIWLQQRNIGTKKHIPTMIMSAASLDDIAAITIFSIFSGMATQSNEILQTLIMIPIEIILGGLLGIVVAKIIRPKQTILITLIALLLGYSDLLLPVSALISVMTFGITLSEQQDTLQVQKDAGSLWIIAEILLFSVVGSMISIETFAAENLGLILVILSIGIMARIVGIRLSIKDGGFNASEKRYISIAYLPKATVQAALASVPLAMGMPYGNLIFVTGVTAIILSTPLTTLYMRKRTVDLMD
ncbi:cation:proton antiporter [Erysipelothrix anatis]|uniref:cation:proton antiporter domain-containing protein n=2 Tax=Erysipelothrix anatis TaxID=2683713 RepID=UPI00135A5F6D|nr:cation:proton antiporter [Erysipelothrix anatis]